METCKRWPVCLSPTWFTLRTPFGMEGNMKLHHKNLIPHKILRALPLVSVNLIIKHAMQSSECKTSEVIITANRYPIMFSYVRFIGHFTHNTSHNQMLFLE